MDHLEAKTDTMYKKNILSKSAHQITFSRLRQRFWKYVSVALGQRSKPMKHFTITNPIKRHLQDSVKPSLKRGGISSKQGTVRTFYYKSSSGFEEFGKHKKKSATMCHLQKRKGKTVDRVKLWQWLHYKRSNAPIKSSDDCVSKNPVVPASTVYPFRYTSQTMGGYSRLIPNMDIVNKHTSLCIGKEVVFMDSQYE